MELALITFVWVILMIIYYTWKWIKEKKHIKELKAKMKNHDKESMTMSIGERLKYKK